MPFFYIKTQIILFTTNHLFAQNEVVTMQFNTSFYYHYSFFCTQLNGSRYSYVSLAIHSNISYLFTYTVKWSNSSISIIQFSVSYLFAHSLNVKRSSTYNHFRVYKQIINIK